jgi:hypothetical protein
VTYERRFSVPDSTSHSPRTLETPAPQGLEDFSAGYRSPVGTFESILKTVLEDFTLSPSAFRLLAYLITKPAGWVINEKQLIFASAWKPNMVRMALRELRRSGLIEDAVVRGADGVIKGHESHLLRHLVVAESPGRNQREEIPPGGETSPGPDLPVQEKPQVGTSERFHHPVVPPPGGETSPIEKTVEVLSEDGKDLSEDEQPFDQLPLIVGVITPPPPPDDGFAAFWAVYPRTVGKEAARKAYAKAAARVGALTVVAGAERFRDDPNLPPKEEARFIPHPATWLNQGRWDDEPLPPRRQSSSNRLTDVRAANARIRAAAGQNPSAVMRHLTAVVTDRKEISS